MTERTMMFLAAIGSFVGILMMSSNDPEKDQIGRYLFIASSAVLLALALMG